MSGPELIYEMSAAIPPGEAQRFAMSRSRGSESRPVQELIASGRRSRVVKKINHYVERGVWVTDPPELTRDHWAGRQRWRIKALFPGAVLMPEAAEKIGVTLSVLDDWISKGLAPDGARPPGASPKAVRLATPELVEIYRQIAALRIPGSANWKADPRGVWVPTQKDTIECPSCACRFTVELTVRPVEPAAEWVGPTQSIGTTDPEPDEDVDEDVDDFDPDDPPSVRRGDELEDQLEPPLEAEPAVGVVEIDGQRRVIPMRSGRILDDELVARMERAVREAREAHVRLGDTATG
jgi:hypothetical protein